MMQKKKQVSQQGAGNLRTLHDVYLCICFKNGERQKEDERSID